MNKALGAYESSFILMPMGLFILRKDQTIFSWNVWMEENTGIKTKDAIGQNLKDLFPDIGYKRFDFALMMSIDCHSPQVLSETLNHYLIPIPINESSYDKISMMHQDVTLTPLDNEGENLVLVTIQDVTRNVHQKNTLMALGKRLEQDSFHDILTGAYNRRFLWDWLERQIEQARRKEFNICCCMYDLDNFKQINDKYGHDFGDEVLIKFSEIVKNCVRATDIFARYGGEEFVTLLPFVDFEQACIQVERIFISLSEIKMKAGNDIVTFTASCGVALWSHENQVSANELIKLADEAMYTAKKAGKNQYRKMEF
ncbi:MAG: diguanylate cyclase [Francisellaceae bacterium]|jgi:diguanylate cyclase